MILVPVEKKFDWRHTPVFLFLIVFLNVIIFFLYQSGDNKKFEDALELYFQNELLKEDWEQYAKWLAEKGEEDLVNEYQAIYDSGEEYYLAINIITDREFYTWWIDQPQPERKTIDDFLDSSFEAKPKARKQVLEIINSTSSYAYGLIPNEISAFKLISHQFLHGGFRHLMGNMVFLVICGFAVEAALGHFKFLLFYILGGIGAGLGHAAVDWHSTVPLVGASGAIAAVVAMYLAIFRFKKIEFFYWFLFFVGYFRAPALLILPFYIGKEFFLFYTDTDSNVAFMAHAGGFVTGAALMVAVLLLKPNLLNQEYVEEDQGIDPKQKTLARVYDSLENLQFQNANNALNELIKNYGINFEFAILRLTIFRLAGSKNIQKCMLDIFNLKRLSEKELQKVEELWEANPSLATTMSEENLIGLAMRLTKLPTPRSAQIIFKQLKDKNCQHPDMKVLSAKLNSASASVK